MNLWVSMVIGIALLILVPVNSASAETFTLSPAPDNPAQTVGDFDSIAAALNGAVDGDVIHLEAGTYHVNLNFPRKAITLRGAPGTTPEDVILNGAYCEEVDPWNCSVIRAQWYEEGGALSPEGTATIEGLSVTGGGSNKAVSEGGGIYLSRANPTLRNLHIRGNHAEDDGGGLFSSGASSRFEGLFIFNNTAEFSGGGIGGGGSSQFIGCRVENNRTTRYHGGGIHWVGGSPVFADLIVTRNRAAENGGGIFLLATTATLENAWFKGNQASRDGGGIYAQGGELTLSQVTLERNTANLRGGGLYTDTPSLALHNSIIAYNLSDSGSNLAVSPEQPLPLGSTLLWLPGGDPGVDGVLNPDEAVVAPPLFYGPPQHTTLANSDVHLRSGSPAIDSGESTRWSNDGFIPSSEADGTAPDLGFYGGITSPSTDGDGDGAPDDWERSFSLDTAGSGDADGDGVSDGDEFNARTHPLNPDSDFDGIQDGDEISTGSDPTDATSPGFNSEDPTLVRVPEDIPDLQSAINVVGDSGHIRVAPGQYDPIEVWFKGSLIESEEGPASTTFSGPAPGSLIAIIGTQPSFVFRGFTITGGESDFGGGLSILGAEGLLETLTVTNNRATTDGGGAYIGCSSITLKGSTFEGNHSDNQGAALLVWGGSPIIQGSTFANNASSAQGGAASFRFVDSGQIIESTFRDNQALSGGGALNLYNASPTIKLSDFTDNIAPWGGAMYLLEQSHPALSQVSLIANEAIKPPDGRSGGGHGGAMFIEYSSPTFNQVLISGNLAETTGGGLYIYFGSSPILSHTTLTHNSAPTGAGLYLAEGETYLHNSIVANNEGAEGPNISSGGGSIIFDRVLAWDSATSTMGLDNVSAPSDSRIYAPPHFWDPDSGNYRLLSPDSAAIDAGASQCLNPDTLDFDIPCTDPDGSPPDVGVFGGPKAGGDEDNDGYARMPWWPEHSAGFPVVSNGYDATLDCDDTRADVHPGAEEICDAKDNDCDGRIDETLCTSSCSAAPEARGHGTLWMGIVGLIALRRWRPWGTSLHPRC